MAPLIRKQLLAMFERITILPLPAVTTADHDILQICEVISKLPAPIGEKVLDEVQFYLMDKAVHGQTEKMFCPSHTEDKEQWAIFLNLNSVRNDTKKRTTIAHEIAHFILGQDMKSTRLGDGRERKADDLCEKWGFGRAYRSYKPLVAK